MWDSRFSRWWRFKSKSSRLLHSVMLLHSEDGGSTVIRNVGILSQHYMTSQPRRHRLKTHKRTTLTDGTDALSTQINVNFPCEIFSTGLARRRVLYTYMPIYISFLSGKINSIVWTMMLSRERERERSVCCKTVQGKVFLLLKIRHEAASASEHVLIVHTTWTGECWASGSWRSAPGKTHCSTL